MRLLTLVLLTLTLCGCGATLRGHWRLIAAEPNAQTFAFDDVQFESDAYSATRTLEGRTRRESGRYAFNGFKLKLWPEVGGFDEYGATLKMQRFEIRDGKRLVTLERVKP